MLLPREFVAYLSRQIVRRLSPGTIETQAPEKITELVHFIISDELEELRSCDRVFVIRSRRLTREFLPPYCDRDIAEMEGVTA